MPDAFVSLVVDDGSELTPALVTRLDAAGWPVVVLRFSDTVSRYADTVLSPELPVIAPDSSSEADISRALAAVRASHGPIGALIYLHGHPTGDPISGDDLVTSVAEAVRRPFILAKCLAADLVEAAAASWGGFFTVTRMDGELGTTGQLPGGLYGLAAGGLAGLVKTLRLEWPNVACRAVDLAPGLGQDQAAELVIGEIYDPSRLIAEVGWGEHGRMTLDAGGRWCDPVLEEMGL